ncbi:hypothetical protein [Legionella hackeliae]|uniref:Uncharacterized protein n=1 Tax=Legionella hackeliae TaxID=449 RepID=A0A0A8UQJ2_LEGHA|nr:hypothetical protein [Legionella hackeliae]KTD10293.1 hypothetical protein Lhac_2661 [Legionella hackeliae]CEK09791.1 conserved membrane protein of unknown function [Legionella hackeliae]STX49701.1 Uncharacterised protein [Legionella hackeliae]
MLLTVALVVFCCAIMVFFSQEWSNFLKKIFAIRGMKLLLPLFVVSFLLVYYEAWVSWGLLTTKWCLHQAADWIASQLPFDFALPVANIILMMGLAVFPVVLANFWIKRKSFEPFQYAFVTSMNIWLLVAILLTVSYSYS